MWSGVKELLPDGSYAPDDLVADFGRAAYWAADPFLVAGMSPGCNLRLAQSVDR